MRYTLLLCFLLSGFATFAQSANAERQLQQLMDRFEAEYYEFELPGLVLDFKTNLANEWQVGASQAQRDFFNSLSTGLKQIDPSGLSQEFLIDYDILSYETVLNLQRLALLAKTDQSIDLEPLEKIYDLEHGADWYAWFVKKWTGSDLSPEQILAFGKEEVARVKAAMNKLAPASDKPDSYFTNDASKITGILREKRDLINSKLPSFMPDFKALPALDIARGTDRRLAQAPGYYNDNTFYFNLFDKPFDLADCDWMLIHEGSPGHHFQVTYHNQLELKPYRQGLSNLGFVEGWAAYTENLGWDIGLYQSDYEALGKWNWDLIRSVRVVLDVGLNYYGWTDEESLAFWQQHIQGQDDIAWREINRMKRWPAQVLTYKLGEAAIREALALQQREKGSDFSFKDFHTAILSKGPVPVSTIPKLLN